MRPVQRFYSLRYLVTLAFFAGGEMAVVLLAIIPIAYGRPVGALIVVAANFVFLFFVRLVLRHWPQRFWETDGTTWIRAKTRDGDVTISKAHVRSVDLSARTIFMESAGGALQITRDSTGYAQLRSLAEEWNADRRPATQ